MLLILLSQGSGFHLVAERARLDVSPSFRVTAFARYDPHGVVTLRVKNANESQNARLPKENDETYRTDSSKARPLLRLRRGASRTVLFALTIPAESGVYGYRRMSLYRLSHRSAVITKSRLGRFEFSDFGSWMFLDDRTLLVWDADLGEQIAHRAPHIYVARWYRLGAKATLIATKRTHRHYEPGWSNNGDRPIYVASKNDPLREFGLVWHYWGL